MRANAGYYHAAYIAATIVYALYTVSIWWRARKVRALLEQRGKKGRN